MEATGQELPIQLNPRQIKFVEYQGLTLPQVYVPVEVQVRNVKTMELRDDDIILCTYPKSGTHWMWRILDMLVSGSAKYSSRIIDHTFLDMQKIHLIRNVESPRVLMTHYPFHLLPEQVKTKSKVKVVHIYRHPKAILVSKLFHMRDLKFPDMSMEKLEESMYTEKTSYGSIFSYWDSVTKLEKENPEVDLIHIAYEDLKEDTAGSIQKLAERLGMKTAKDMCLQIAEAVNFQNQKTREENMRNANLNKVNYYRKGEVEDWKNHMTVAQSERIGKIIKDRAPTCVFSRRYLEKQSA